MRQKDDQRQHHALRLHIDCLLASGASLIGRDPVRLSFEGRLLTVNYGVLVNEDGHLDLLETIADLEWLDPHRHGLAMDICLQQISQAIESVADTAGNPGHEPGAGLTSHLAK